MAYAVGVLLGTAFLNLLPEAADRLGREEVLIACLAGVLGFFALEKLALWRHAHVHGEASGHARPKASGALILLGDGLHNFVDGVLIAAAFLTDPSLGWAVAVGVVAYVLAVSAASFLYIAVADLIPELHRHWGLRDGAKKIAQSKWA